MLTIKPTLQSIIFASGKLNQTEKEDFFRALTVLSESEREELTDIFLEEPEMIKILCENFRKKVAYTKSKKSWDDIIAEEVDYLQKRSG